MAPCLSRALLCWQLAPRRVSQTNEGEQEAPVSGGPVEQAATVATDVVRHDFVLPYDLLFGCVCDSVGVRLAWYPVRMMVLSSVKNECTVTVYSPNTVERCRERRASRIRPRARLTTEQGTLS